MATAFQALAGTVLADAAWPVARRIIWLANAADMAWLDCEHLAELKQTSMIATQSPWLRLP